MRLRQLAAAAPSLIASHEETIRAKMLIPRRVAEDLDLHSAYGVAHAGRLVELAFQFHGIESSVFYVNFTSGEHAFVDRSILRKGSWVKIQIEGAGSTDWKGPN
jgi:hypothetical protein